MGPSSPRHNWVLATSDTVRGGSGLLDIIDTLGPPNTADDDASVAGSGTRVPLRGATFPPLKSGTGLQSIRKADYIRSGRITQVGTHIPTSIHGKLNTTPARLLKRYNE